MTKTNSFVKFLKKINKSINNLLEKNLNNLKLNNLLNLARSNKIVLTFVALLIVFVSYLLLPSFFNQNEVSKELKSELSNKLNLDVEFSKSLKYNLFPRPHFTSSDVVINYNNLEISNIKKFIIYVSLDNLFKLKNIKIEDIILENSNFYLNKKNYNFFLNLADENFKNNEVKILMKKLYL